MINVCLKHTFISECWQSHNSYRVIYQSLCEEWKWMVGGIYTYRGHNFSYNRLMIFFTSSIDLSELIKWLFRSSLFGRCRLILIIPQSESILLRWIVELPCMTQWQTIIINQCNNMLTSDSIRTPSPPQKKKKQKKNKKTKNKTKNKTKQNKTTTTNKLTKTKQNKNKETNNI